MCAAASISFGQPADETNNLTPLKEAENNDNTLPLPTDLGESLLSNPPSNLEDYQIGPNIVPATPETEANISQPTLDIIETPTTPSPVERQGNEASITLNNIMAIWLRLAAIGKSQYEIESYLNTATPQLIMQTKQKLRKMAFLNIKNRVSAFTNSADKNITNQLKKMIFSYITSYGLEADDILIDEIKKELGIVL